MFIQLIINGIVLGLLYSLAGIGFALVYNTTRIFHLSYSVIYTFASYMLLLFYINMHFDFLLSLLLSIIMTCILSIANYYLVYEPLLKIKSSLVVIMISSIGAMIILINMIALLFGNETKIINPGIVDSVSFYNLIITNNQLTQFIISISLISVFVLFLKYSKLGINTRAMRDDLELSSVLGLNVNKMYIIIFSLSGLFAAVSSCLVAYDIGMDPYVGMPIFLYGVVAMIIGGVGRFESPVIGGVILGILQSVTVWAASSKWQDAITFLVLVIFLLFRPQGILGERQRIV